MKRSSYFVLAIGILSVVGMWAGPPELRDENMYHAATAAQQAHSETLNLVLGIVGLAVAQTAFWWGLVLFSQGAKPRWPCVTGAVLGALSGLMWLAGLLFPPFEM